MKSYKMAMMADFTKNINPADRRLRMIAEYLQKNNFEVSPLRNFSHYDWLRASFKKFDIIHTRGWPPERYVLRILPHRYIVHSILGHFEGEPKNSVNIRRWLCKKADIVHIGYLISKKIIMDEGVPEEKIRHIHNPIDTDLFTPKLQKDNERVKVLFVSSYLERKSPQLVVQLAKKFPAFDFIMYGSHGDSELFKQIFNESKKLENLFVNKTVDYYRLPEVYQSADMFIFPSVQGEFGNVVIEALSCGLPVISMEKGAEEIIQHGINGFLCKELDEFSKYIQILAEDKALIMNMKKEARKTAVNEFSKEVIFRKYLDMYMELLGDEK
jgi:glycosyltransferase involved in cell wall biosynthesis